VGDRSGDFGGLGADAGVEVLAAQSVAVALEGEDLGVVDEPVDHRGGGQLLARGQVIHAVEDVRDGEAWRAEIRRQARADKIKVRTGSNEAIVWALLVRAGCPDALVGARGYRDLLARTVPLAVELRHEPILAVRDGEEVVVCSVGAG
jgi:hypothetical protein